MSTNTTTTTTTTFVATTAAAPASAAAPTSAMDAIVNHDIWASADFSTTICTHAKPLCDEFRTYLDRYNAHANSAQWVQLRKNTTMDVKLLTVDDLDCMLHPSFTSPTSPIPPPPPPQVHVRRRTAAATTSSTTSAPSSSSSSSRVLFDSGGGGNKEEEEDGCASGGALWQLRKLSDTQMQLRVFVHSSCVHSLQALRILIASVVCYAEAMLDHAVYIQNQHRVFPTAYVPSRDHESIMVRKMFLQYAQVLLKHNATAVDMTGQAMRIFLPRLNMFGAMQYCSSSSSSSGGTCCHAILRNREPWIAPFREWQQITWTNYARELQKEMMQVLPSQPTIKNCCCAPLAAPTRLTQQQQQHIHPIHPRETRPITTTTQTQGNQGMVDEEKGGGGGGVLQQQKRQGQEKVSRKREREKVLCQRCNKCECKIEETVPPPPADDITMTVTGDKKETKKKKKVKLESN